MDTSARQTPTTPKGLARPSEATGGYGVGCGAGSSRGIRCVSGRSAISRRAKSTTSPRCRGAARTTSRTCRRSVLGTTPPRPSPATVGSGERDGERLRVYVYRTEVPRARNRGCVDGRRKPRPPTKPREPAKGDRGGQKAGSEARKPLSPLRVQRRRFRGVGGRWKNVVPGSAEAVLEFVETAKEGVETQ